MRSTIYSWLGHEFVALSAEGRSELGASEQAQDVFQRFDVEWLKRPRHIRCRSDQSQRKVESTLANSASHEDEIQHEHNGQRAATSRLSEPNFRDPQLIDPATAKSQAG
jgi:hypothetical protein